jgi:hypothetical protein
MIPFCNANDYKLSLKGTFFKVPGYSAFIFLFLPQF